MSSLPNVQQQDPSLTASPVPLSIDSWMEKRLDNLVKSDVMHTKCIITSLPSRYRPAIEAILHSRWDNRLSSLLATEKQISLSNSELSQTVMHTTSHELITLLYPDRCSRVWDWKWKPLNPSLQTPSQVAEDAHLAVFNAFSKIRPGEFLRWMFGDEVGAMTELFRGASSTSDALRQRYYELNQPKILYTNVAKACGSTL